MLYVSLNIKEILSADDFKNFVFQVKRKTREFVLVSPQKWVWGTLSYDSISLVEINYECLAIKAFVVHLTHNCHGRNSQMTVTSNDITKSHIKSPV